jgi:murein DD-endopeptidase MepM/ murein hydrolase activator NlpD
MKNNNVNKITAIFLTLIMVFGLIPSMGFAQPNPSSPINEVKGFNVSVFDSHFSRADREINPERWLAEAKIGITQAVYAWELIAFGMYENPLLFEEAKAKLEDWSGKELEARFSRWLNKRFFGETMGKAVSEFSSMLEETQKKYTWRLDDEGNVIFDEGTGDPLVIRPGDEGREFSAEQIIWRSEADKLAEKNSGYFDAVMINMYPELLAYIPAELRETMSAAIKEAGMAASAGLKREFENIAAREQRLFTSRRTRDIWSLRKKSDDEAARVFTEQLIFETEQACAIGINSLNTKIEQAYAGTGDLALIGEEWLQLYKEQFDRGLKAWEEAEERFFIRRLEWEQDSVKLFSEGEEIWLAAFEKINEEYQKWELKAKELFDSGEQLFKNISDNLEKNIADAKIEFEINKNMRVGTGTEKAKALIDMYITGASAAITAKENLQYWLDNFYSGKNVNDSDLADGLLNERKYCWFQLEESITKFLMKMPSYYELSFLDRYRMKIPNERVFLEIINEANRRLAITQDIISGKLSFAEEMAFANEEFAFGNNKKYYSFDYDRFIRLCDIQKNYNLYTSYIEIAADAREKILADYAELLGTGVLKDIFSPNASTEDFYLDEYQLALVRAKTLVLYWERKTSVAQAVISYSEKIDAGRMTEAESIQAWEKAKSDYNKSLALYEAELTKLNEIGENVQSRKILLDELTKTMVEEEDKLNRLNQEYSMLVARSYASIGSIVETEFNSKYNFLAGEYKNFLKTGKDALYNDILEYGMNWDIARQKEEAEKTLAFYVKEAEAASAKPESTVQTKTRLALIDLFADNIANSGANYQLRSSNSAYSGADWYSKAKGITLSKEEKTALYGEKLAERLFDDYKESQLTLLKKRLDYELNILEKILKNNNMAELPADAMAELKIKSYELADIALIYNVLSDLKKRVDSNMGFYTKDNDENELIEYYILADTLCVNTENELIDFYNDFNYCSKLLEVYCDFASISSFGQRENRQDLFKKTSEFLAGYGLYNIEKFFPDAQTIFEAILNKGGNTIENSVLFFKGLQNCFSVSPEWLENEFYPWKNAVLEYIAANIFSFEDEANSEKHWRQFLKEKYIDKVDSVLAGASTPEEGVIEDAQFAAEYYTNRLNDAFDLFSKTNFSAPELTAQTLFSHYSFSFSDIENRFFSLNYYYNDLSNFGRSLEISELSQEDAKKQSNIVYKETNAQKEKFNISRNNYFAEAEKFLEIGNLYDNQYKAVKNAYNDTENKRFEYEKEDAIRRWASTAYLGADSDNYSDCKNKLEKAQVVLNVLMEINKNEKHVYNNPEYNALYAEYEQSFTRKIKALDALETVSTMLARENLNNETYFKNYNRVLFNFGALASVDNINDWPYKNIITVKDGKLAFSMDSSWAITDNSNPIVNNSFFISQKLLDGEMYEISPFEEALRGLSQRMAAYLNNPDKLRQWSYAREYIISSLISANSNLEYLPKYPAGFGELEEGRPLGGELYKSGILYKNHTLNSYFDYTRYIDYNEFGKEGYYNKNKYEDNEILLGQLYYMSLSSAERADLEFYIILTLTGGGNDYISGFKEIINADLYQEAYDMVNGYYKHAFNQSYKWYTLFFYDEMKDINRNTLERIEPVLNDSKTEVNKFVSGLKNDLLSIQNYGNSYLTSCNNIIILNGEKEAGQNILWDDINKALAVTKKFNSEDIKIIKTTWEKMQDASFSSFKNIYDALSGLVRWTKSEEIRIRNDLEKVWLTDTQKQQDYENKYLSAVENFILGTGNINTLKAAAENAYGKNSAFQIKHLENIHTALINDFSMYLNMENNHYSEFAYLGHELQLLTEKMFENRYAAELEAREIEWEQMRADIFVKANEWQNSVSLILGNGRTEWEAGKQRMNESYKQWYANFQSEMRRVENEWAQAYLAGLEDKDTWLEQAASAFNQASADSFLQLVGTEGERLSRFMDAREPFGVRNALPEAQAIMTSLLQSSGIVNMTNAFSSMNNISDTAAVKVRKGLGGVSSWDAAVVKTAAKDIAVKTNAEIADAEARKLAHNAKKTINEVISQIYTNVDGANKNFRENMDNIFFRDGLWRQNGTNYEKDIVKGSTLFQPVISQRQTVEGYKDYKMEPVSLKSNLDEKILAELNSIAIRVLMENAYEEIMDITKDIFENDKYMKSISEDRGQSPGRFGVHIGYQPKRKPDKEFGDTKESFFYDEGEGELGRLMTDFIYWGVIDARGSAELSLAPWDKRMWNDENSFFSAPSLRTVGQIAATVAVTIASGGGGIIGGALTLGNIATTALVSSASNILFGTLDMTFGYKSFGEVAFDIGKSLLVNSASSAISGTFGNLTSNVVKTASGTAGKIITETAMTGLQSVTASMAANALNSFTYEKGHIGWSNEIFSSGMKDSMTSAVTAMAGTFTTQSLTAINSGFELDKLKGFDIDNVTDLKKFNDLAGSLAGQGVNYAMGGDFTLNLLNLSLLTRNDDYKTGLLELHLGRNGTTMNLGTGGANISLDNLAASFRGLKVWDVNNMISSFIKKEDDFDANAALRSLYGFGEKEQKDQLWDILNGKTIINTDSEGKFGAESVRDENDKKVINLTGYKSGMSVEDQLLVGVLLGHEAYRDGYVTDNQKQETGTAALMHTEMAIRMIQGGYLSLLMDDNLRKDIVAYNIGKDFFNDYIDKKYDSSGDFWKLMRDGTLVFNNDGWLVDEENNPYYDKDGKKIGSMGIETGLLKILFGEPGKGKSFTKEQVLFAQQLMTEAGINHTATNEKDISTYSWKVEDWDKIPDDKKPVYTLNMQKIMEKVGSTVAAPVFARYYEDVATKMAAGFLKKKININNNHSIPDNALSRFSDDLLPAVIDYYQSMRFFFDASAKMKVSQEHGSTKVEYENYKKHFGTDFSNQKSGDSIYLGIAGKVVYTGEYKTKDDRNGNWIVVEHGYEFDGSFIGSGVFGEYMHMKDKPDFEKGAYLDSNQIIGKVGNTGRSDGPHLHYSIYTLKEGTYTVAALNMILNNNTSKTVVSNTVSGYQGSYGKYTSLKTTYDIQNFLNGLKK